MKNLTLGIDIALDSTNSMLTGTSDVKNTITKDLATVDDVDVVRQALIKRLNARKGDLWAHPEYGNDIWDLLSDLMSDDWIKQALIAVQDCVNDDPRAQIVEVTYNAIREERQITFNIVYQIIDGRQDNLVWDYAPEAVVDSV
jgi:phage baseplate assembly protein W